jgi:hypothetical protein
LEYTRQTRLCEQGGGELAEERGEEGEGLYADAVGGGVEEGEDGRDE